MFKASVFRRVELKMHLSMAITVTSLCFHAERPRCLGTACQLFIIMILVLIEIALVVTVLVFRPENGQVKVTYFMQEEQKMAFLLCTFFGQ